MDKHEKCMYYIIKSFPSKLKRKTDVFKFTRFEARICDESLPEVQRL